MTMTTTKLIKRIDDRDDDDVYIYLFIDVSRKLLSWQQLGHSISGAGVEMIPWGPQHLHHLSQLITVNKTGTRFFCFSSSLNSKCMHAAASIIDQLMNGHDKFFVFNWKLSLFVVYAVYVNRKMKEKERMIFWE